MSQRILIVEDEEHVAAFYRETLEGAGYATWTVHTGLEALAALGEFAPDLVLLDIQLAGHMDGFAVLGALRKHSDVRVMVITGQRAAPADLVRGLDLGADEYVVKPVPRGPLLARVRARLRWLADAAGATYRVGDVTIDLERKTVARGDGPPQSLGPVEARVLARLAQTPGRVVAMRELLRAGWGYEGGGVYRDDHRLIETIVYRLRSKMETAPRQPRLILTIRGEGFKIVKGDIGTGNG